MSGKILTVSVAAYNVEQYIKQNLDSMTVPELVDKLEIFVVDDGGKDGTLEIAKEYEAKYPGTVYAVHKENGGYGSTVNYSIAHATGKYFKLLDGDDWFNTANLIKFVELLENGNEDLIITDYFKGPEEGSMKTVNIGERNLNVTKTEDIKKIIGHWSIAYKTEILKASGLELPEHLFYTDKIFSTIPMALVKSVKAYALPVYSYRIGRDGQSVSRESRIKNVKNYLNICNIICDYCGKINASPEKNKYVFRRAVSDYRLGIKTALLCPNKKENLAMIKEYESRNKQKNNKVFTAAGKTTSKTGKLICFMRKTKYLGYWGLALIPKSKLDF